MSRLISNKCFLGRLFFPENFQQWLFLLSFPNKQPLGLDFFLSKKLEDWSFGSFQKVKTHISSGHMRWTHIPD